MAKGDEVLIHKVLPNETIDSIIKSYYGTLPGPHLCSMRDHLHYLNREQSNYTPRPGGISVGTQPSQGEFLILPSIETLNAFNFHSNQAQLSAFSSFPTMSRDTRHDLRLDFSLRSDVNKFQKNVDPLLAIAFSEILDGIFYILSKKEHWNEKLKDYTGDYFKEIASKIAERGAEFYASLNAFEETLFKYSSSKEKVARQALKKEVVKAHKEMNKSLSKLVQKWFQKNASSNSVKSLVNSNKAMDSADLYFKNGGPRPVILKKSFDRYLKFLKYGNLVPEIGTLADFLSVQYGAFTAHKNGKDWEKELFIKDAGVLGLIGGTAFAGVIIGAAGIPLLIGAVISISFAATGSAFIEDKATWVYEKWLQ